MEIFNIGPLELIFILVIAIIVLGPKEMLNFAKKAGSWVVKVQKSEIWHSLMETSREIKDLPRKIMREAQIEDIKNDLEINRKKTPISDFEKWEESLVTKKEDKPKSSENEE